jgi:hypothetical protein
MLQTCIRKVLGSNLGPTLGTLTEVFVAFLDPSRKIPEE